jgi:MFS family permease
MLAHLSPIAALLAGMGIVLVGSGLLGTLLPVRGNLEGFSEVTIGVVMAGFYVGFLVGTVWCPRIIRGVGHIRAFATFAALATVCILAHSAFISAPVWTALRGLVGVSLIGIYITVESWLNERAERSNRGTILAVYETIGLGALAAGQFFIIVGDVRTTLPFMLAAGLFALGLIPVALTRLPEPDLSRPSRLTIGQLFRISPVAAVGTVAAAAAAGGFFSMGPLFAQQLGLPESGIAAYMSAALIGGAALQWPIGGLSDRMDRRVVIGGTALVAALAAVGILLLAAQGQTALLTATFVFGGTMLVLYALCVAHANDLLPQAQFLDAARAINFLYAIGAAAAPVIIGALMARFGGAGLFGTSALLLGGLGVFALVGAILRPVVPVEAREEFVAVTTPSAEALEMYPHTPIEPDR